jgi:GNAT superfamily N-acetyltransferase
MSTIRPCGTKDFAVILAIVNAAATAYRGVIPADQWHEPYMPGDELEREIGAGVVFWGLERDGMLTGVMGLQRVGDVDLIRHAYVRPADQRRGIGGVLLRQLRAMSSRQMLVGTWRAAEWAISFYERHGFQMVSSSDKERLLETYWTVSPRQAKVSVVLADPPLPSRGAP